MVDKIQIMEVLKCFRLFRFSFHCQALLTWWLQALDAGAQIINVMLLLPKTVSVFPCSATFPTGEMLANWIYNEQSEYDRCIWDS